MASINRPILVVEDNDEDFTVTEWALKKSRPNVSLVRCTNGQKAIEYLEAAGNTSEAVANPLPAFVLLDLNLPRTNGHQVLRHIKASERLVPLPVIVYTSSSSREDVRACFQNGVNSYIVKPINMAETLELLHALVEYWLRLSVLPEIAEGN